MVGVTVTVTFDGLAVPHVTAATDLDAFAAVPIGEDLLVDIADELGLQTVDSGLAQFMDSLCAGCDPENREHQACVKRFAAMPWQVECPAHPEWAQEHFHCVEHWTAEAGPVIGARAGPGVVGLCWYREDDIK